MRWLGGNRVRRDAEAALAVLEDYERRIYSGEMHIRIEKGIKVPGDQAPILYRAVLWKEDVGDVGQLMFSWYVRSEPDANFVTQQLGTFLGMAVTIRDGIRLGGSLRFQHHSHQPRGLAVLEMDYESPPPDLLRLELIAPQP